jgi:hypothetical protein
MVTLLRRLVRHNDPKAVESQGLLMGERGWLYHRAGHFAYAVTAGAKRVTLHALPMYCDPALHAAGRRLIPEGDFGKGCVRFKPDAEVDATVLARFIRACARVDVKRPG